MKTTMWRKLLRWAAFMLLSVYTVLLLAYTVSAAVRGEDLGVVVLSTMTVLVLLSAGKMASIIGAAKETGTPSNVGVITDTQANERVMEAEVTFDRGTKLLCFYLHPNEINEMGMALPLPEHMLRDLDDGDKVKVIIVKED